VASGGVEAQPGQRLEDQPSVACSASRAAWSNRHESVCSSVAGIGTDLGAQQGGGLALARDDLDALADLLGRAVVAAAKPALHALQVRSTIPATSSRRQNSATTGNAPSSFSALGGA